MPIWLLLQCPSDYYHDITPQSQKVVSLSNSGPDGCGKVEIFHNGSWGTVCASEWSNIDAQVVCRGLGLSGGSARSGSHHFSSKVEGQPIWMSEVNCYGMEERLENCGFDGLWRHPCNTHDAHVCCGKVSNMSYICNALHANLLAG